MTASRHLRAAPGRAYPENYVYADNGCDLHPSCLACPLPVCAYERDDPYARPALADTVQRLIDDGASFERITEATGVSRSTLFRWRRAGHVR